jgi:hypothetical protein
MFKFLSYFATRSTATLCVCAIAGGLVVSTPTQAKATDWATIAVGAALIGIVFGGVTKKPKYTVIARYCENSKTGLYHQC